MLCTNDTGCFKHLTVRPHPFVGKVNMIRKVTTFSDGFVSLIHILIENEVARNGINVSIMRFSCWLTTRI